MLIAVNSTNTAVNTGLRVKIIHKTRRHIEVEKVGTGAH